MGETERKRPGPAPKFAAGRTTLTVRLTEETREWIAARAAKAGRSLSEGVEYELEQIKSGPFSDGANVQVLAAAGNAIAAIERIGRARWFDDKATSIRACRAAKAVLDSIMLPDTGEVAAFDQSDVNRLTGHVPTEAERGEAYRRLGEAFAKGYFDKIVSAIETISEPDEPAPERSAGGPQQKKARKREPSEI